MFRWKGGFYFMKKYFTFSVYDMCEIGLLVAAAIVLDLPFLKFKLFSNGGSISLTMLPLFILAIRQGPFKGFLAAGVIYGCIDCLIDGNPASSIPLDYLLGYGSAFVLGFTNDICRKGLTTKKYIVCALLCLLATFIRLCFGTLSGIVQWETPFVDSLIYNMTYILPTGGFATIGTLLLLKPSEQVGRKLA